MSITTPRKKDEVECTICHKTQQYRSIDSHWAFEYRTHPSDTQHSLRYTVINNEDVAENNSDQDQDEDIEDSLSTTQQQIPQLFAKIAVENEHKNKLLTNSTYLIKQINNVIETLQAHSGSSTISAEELFETKENGYQSAFDSLFSELSVGKTKQLLECIVDVIDAKKYEVWDLSDLLMKFQFHGLRAYKHPDCKENEILIYCNICCKCPIYPKDRKGTITTGRIINTKTCNEDGKENKKK
eukprot:460870_1